MTEASKDWDPMLSEQRILLQKVYFELMESGLFISVDMIPNVGDRNFTIYCEGKK